MKWQPIETAPKDGRVILGYWNPEYAETIAFRNGEWVWSNDCDSWTKGRPTHWIPFEPPEDAASLTLDAVQAIFASVQALP